MCDHTNFFLNLFHCKISVLYCDENCNISVMYHQMRMSVVTARACVSNNVRTRLEVTDAHAGEVIHLWKMENAKVNARMGRWMGG